ncbi:MAG: DUF488 domain-containing protein [Ignavibacteriae bacterium]|nr:MAG: DUF488 domain-containing protein [Ignavibacteriota bacterium]
MVKLITYPKEIWTIGHSKHPAEEFINILKSFNIELIVDVRRIPYSRRVPQFNKENIEQSLIENNFGYVHLPEIGGKRDPIPNSQNTKWRTKAFRGYADYMETDEFKEGIRELCELANEKRTAYMCAEADWKKCHRSLISDHLKTHSVIVNHIMGINKIQVHPYTYAANVVQGELKYE